jgi:arylsulfatase A-like enzyme
MNEPNPSALFHAATRHDRAGMLATLAAASHLLLLVVIQVEDYVLYLWPANHSVGALLSFAAGLGLAQWENIAAAVALGAVTLFTAAIRPGRWLAFSLVILANLYLVIDQVGFKLFFDHLDPSMLEGAERLGDLRSSVLAELDGAFFLNLVLLFVIGRRLHAAFFDPATLQRLPYAARLAHLPRSHAAQAVVAVLLVTGLLFPVRPNFVKLYHHPFHNLVLYLSTPAAGSAPPAVAAVTEASAAPSVASETLDLQHLRFGTAPDDPQSDQALAAALQAAQEHRPAWNVLWIVLESVGSKQLLTHDGRPDPALTPNLARLAEHGALFNSLYSVFPGTVRSHVDMATGGRTLTWGSVFKELTHPYEGPTVARTFSGAGYDTALFSAQKLDFENMNGFYKNVGFDYYYDFGEADSKFQEQNTLQSWGAKEGPIMALAVKWLDQRHDRRPFFLKYLTVATHHPYDVPDDFRRPVMGTTREDNYQNALAYTDQAIGILLRQLQAHHLLDNTLIVINGDHGEAFGTFHPQNFLHKNYIYEENIKNFLLISNPNLFPRPIVSPRVGSISDIMPTLLALTGQPPADVPGQDLMGRDYTPRLVFFYKNAFPEQWGLRDGQWKYIAEEQGGRAELYDLSFDHDEANNLAQIYPDRVALYDKLAGHWYVQTNHEFISRLKDFRYPGGRELSDADLRSAGPKLITFGYQKAAKGGGDPEFVEDLQVNPYEQVVAWTHWVNYPRDKMIQYVWQAPNGDHYTVDFKVLPIWATTFVNNNAPLPLQEGKWQVSLKDGDRTLLTGSFTVDHSAPLHVPRSEIQATEIAMGKYVITDLGKEKFVKTDHMDPTDRIAVWTRWKPFDHDHRIVYRWKSPSGKEQAFYFDAKRGWDQTQVNFTNNGKPLESGHWEVSLWDGDRKVSSTGFEVEKAAP